MQEQIDLWKEIESLDWEKDTDYERIQRELAAQPEKRKALDDFRFEKYHDLAKAFWIYVGRTDYREYLSNDGVDDLINHIIGLGQVPYEYALGNPQLALDRYEAGDYDESFAYAFHTI
jgi:hypothetical protein